MLHTRDPVAPNSSGEKEEAEGIERASDANVLDVDVLVIDVPEVAVLDVDVPDVDALDVDVLDVELVVALDAVVDVCRRTVTRACKTRSRKHPRCTRGRQHPQSPEQMPKHLRV